MKLFVGILFLISMKSFALDSAGSTNYSYSCMHTKDSKDRIFVTMNLKKLVIINASWAQSKGNLNYDYEGVIKGMGQMNGRVEYGLNLETSTTLPEEAMDELFVTKSMLFGGSQFKNGTRGGYITYLGHMYSYESYICFRTK